MRDHAYIYKELGLEFEFWKFPKGLFRITKQVADDIWKSKKEYFNSFDYIVTSDTAPLSRIFMENIHDMKPKVVVWICNRFDYNMETDSSFYDIFRKISNQNTETFKIIPYSDFEGVYCNTKNVYSFLPTITPIGINLKELDYKIDGLDELNKSYIEDNNAKEKYNNGNDLLNKMFIPIYQNDNIFFNLKQIFQDKNIDYFNGGYMHMEDLKLCKGFVTFPDAFSKLITFETIQHEIIVFLPSEEFLIQLHSKQNNNTSYWFNCPFGLLNNKLINFCEWYKYKECRIYFNSIDDLIFKIQNLTPEIVNEKKRWCKIYGEQIKQANLEKWKQIFI
jgi:hypothetical protein